MGKRENLRRMWAESSSYEELSEKTGLAVSTLRTYASRFGWGSLTKPGVASSLRDTQLNSSRRTHDYKKFAEVWNASDSVDDFLINYKPQLSKPNAYGLASTLRKMGYTLKSFKPGEKGYINSHTFIAVWNTSDSVDEVCAAFEEFELSPSSAKSKAGSLRRQGYWLKSMRGRNPSLLRCPKCKSPNNTKNGAMRDIPQYICSDCGRKYSQTAVLDEVAIQLGFDDWREIEKALANMEVTLQLFSPYSEKQT